MPEEFTDRIDDLYIAQVSQYETLFQYLININTQHYENIKHLDETIQKMQDRLNFLQKQPMTTISIEDRLKLLKTPKRTTATTTLTSLII